MSAESSIETAHSEGRFEGLHGHSIYWQSWSPARGRPARATVVIAHGYAEHSGRYRFVAERLVKAGYRVFAPDHHGHGRSDGRRAQIVLADAVADLDQIVDIAAGADPGAALCLVGHSLGGAIALRYALAYQRRLTGLVLSGPVAAIEGSSALAQVGKLLGRLAPGLPVAKLDANDVSRDPAIVERYRADPLVYHRPMPAVTARELVLHVQTLPQDARAITLPTLLIYGTEDRLCPIRGAMMLADRIGSADLTVKAYVGLFHEVLNEPERDSVIRDVVSWLDSRTGSDRPLRALVGD